MKKFLIVLFGFLSIAPISTFAGVSGYGSGEITTAVDYQSGFLTVRNRDYRSNTTCDDYSLDEKIYFRLGNSGTWTKVYDRNNAVAAYASTSTAANHFRTTTIQTLPAAFFEQNVQVRVTLRWREESGFFCDGNSIYPDYTYDINNTIDSPTAVSSTLDGSCTGVAISVDATGLSTKYGSQLRMGLSRNTGTPTYDNTKITSLFDNGATPGQTYTYTVKTELHWTNNGQLRIARSSGLNVQGRRLGPRVSPSGLFLEQEGCAGHIGVNWNWSESTNPDNFVVQRASNRAFTVGLVENIVSGSDRDFRDRGTTSGNKYYYRIFSQLDCPTSSAKLKSAPTAVDTIFGLGIPAAPAITGLTIDTTAKRVTVSWSDNSGMESGFKVVRQSSTAQVEYDAPENATSYIDKSAAICTNFTYTVKAVNSCKTTGVLSPNDSSTYIPSNVGTTFNATNRIEAGDGEAGDRIDLKWRTANNQNDFWNIQRINPLTKDTILIASPDGRTKFFSDNTADANTFYKYIIQGESDCAGNTELSNISEDYGFRLAFGTVNGQITYQGGVAVEGVKVTARPASGSSGSTGDFNGTTSFATVQNNDLMHLDSLTIQTYFYAEDLSGIQIIADKSTGNSGFKFGLNGDQLELRIQGQTFTTNDSVIRAQEWISATAVVSPDSVKLFLGNRLSKSFANSSSTLDTLSNLNIGKDATGNYFDGNLDELRLYNRPLSNLEVQRSFDVYINPSSAGLVGYWRFDEGFGSTAYDYSKTIQSSNKNHAILNNASFDAGNKPTTTQLTSGAYTDKNGSYFIPFIPFLGSGDNFILEPTFGTHSFDPATTTLLIGSGSANFTGQDFEDQSSFSVSGTVAYGNDRDTTDCFVKGARLLIDGDVVIRFGEVATTDETGFFDIQVPIGEHVVTVEKTSHDFYSSRFPAIGSFDFQQNKQGIKFIDSTLVKVVGRVAGGSIQENLPPALGRGKNNIGSAKVPFRAERGNGCLVDTAITSSITGEYEIKLPPLKYIMPEFRIDSNKSILFDENALLDLSNVPPVQTSTDSVFRRVNGREVLDRVDSAKYQMQRDFIYFESPSLGVRGKEVAAQFGSDTVEYTKAGVTDKIPTSDLNLNYPIFEENDEYTWLISAFEIYQNKDGASIILDSVPMKEGNIEIINNLAAVASKTFEYKITDTVEFNGIQEYTFKGGQANTAANSQIPRFSYTKTCEISLRPDNGNAVDWEYNSQDLDNKDFRGVVFGARSLGSSFATQGPELVTMILRDPPGTNSSSSWSKDISHTTTNSFDIGVAAGLSVNKKAKMGTKFSVGLGYITETEISSDITNKYKYEGSVSSGGDFVEVTTNSVDLRTGVGDEFVGSGADLFFGRSYNMDFGLSQSITLIDTSDCGAEANNCFGSPFTSGGRTYKLGSTIGMFIIPGGYGTEFVFTQTGIENSVIPKLVSLRNQLLIADTNIYKSYLPFGHANYGKSNDDPIFGIEATPNDESNNLIDSLGKSYYYKGYTRESRNVTNAFGVQVSLNITTGVDSVWWYNQQIALWVDALRRNERAKALPGAKIQNVSYQSGSVITFTESTSRDTSTTTNISMNISKDLAFNLGAEIGNNGFEIENTVGVKMSTNTSFVRGTKSTTTFSYTLDDQDNTDEFSVDIFSAPDGYGPIFKTRGGQTSCPYQGEYKTKYFRPGLVTLDNATIQAEDPGISASPAQTFNVPANSQANISLNLINNGVEDASYSLKVLESTNPNGAILKVDGINPNRNFEVPAGTSINKILTVEKGPNHISYDSIGIVFHSICQYDFGNANYEDIADTVYVSVDFLPSCTELKVQSPQNQFVANNTFNNSLPVLISGYDINYSGLEKIELQYKPSNQASWIPLGTDWFKDTIGIKNRYPNHTDARQIPRGQSYISYQLEMDELIDQDYDLRAIATCKIPFNPEFDQESNVISGIFDRVNPHPFGSPTPADGVLDPNDDISIQFNEEIEAGSLTRNHFQITGVLNGQELRHDKAIAFNGTNEYLEIDNGFDFASGSFTIEFWMNRKSLGSKQTILSQGANSGNIFAIGWDTDDKMFVTIGSVTYKSNFAILDDSLWHHYAVTYDKENLNLEIADRKASSSQVSTDNNFFSTFQSGGKTFIGKSAENGGEFFNGSMHQLRIWNKALGFGEVSTRINQNLHGREAGLVGFWPMDKGRGDLAEDKARARNAEINAQWEINPKSTSLGLNGINQCASVDSAGTVAITQEMDLSFEFWFKTQGGRLQTLLSNGSGRFDSADVNRNGWNIEMNAQNEIWVKNDSFAFKAVETNFADDNWHHFALVVNRLSNATAYIDGTQQKSTTATNFWGFSGSKLYLGARFYLNGTQEIVDQFYDGEIDEVRIWNTALLRENIELNRYNRMKGDEFGLLAYYPFESYRLEVGVPVLDTALTNESDIMRVPQRANARAIGGSLYSTESPAVAIQRPVEEIKYSWSVNNDRIVITPNEDASNIENVTLNVSVQGVRDLHGNMMQSPKKWIAFVNKNQVVWQDFEKNLEKEFNDPLSFTSKIVNSGGELKTFNITNIPAWLTVSPSTGSIDPLTTQTITFTVNPAINIGDYSEDVLLTTDFGFAEKLLVNLRVRKIAPDFTFDASQYSKTMNVVGQIRINGNISVNDEDLLIAYAADSIRGASSLQYIENLDAYIVFLDIYGNSNDSIYFKVWNSREGELHEEVTPSINFVENKVTGSLLQPQIFDAINKVSKPIILERGWNWVSFPLADEKMESISSFMSGLRFNDGDMIKTRGNNANANYGGSAFGWSGDLLNEGILNEKSYLIHISNKDTLNFSGFQIDPDTVPINVVAGWNRIGFVSLKNVDINTALANYNATDGDLIKGQQSFALYLSSLGWIGSLTTLEPTEGYLLKAANSATFTYPRRGLFRLKATPEQEKLENQLAGGFSLNPADFEASTNAIVEINTCDEIVEDENWVLAAFKDDELRGWSDKAIKEDDNASAKHYLTVFGEAKEKFSLMLYNKESKQKLLLKGKLKYEKNTLQGTPNEPLAFNVEIKQDCDQFRSIEEEVVDELTQKLSYPNPFKDFVTIAVPNSISENGNLKIIDQTGRVLYESRVGDRERIFLNGAELHSFKTGVYQVKFIDGDTIVSEKLVRIQR